MEFSFTQLKPISMMWSFPSMSLFTLFKLIQPSFLISVFLSGNFPQVGRQHQQFRFPRKVLILPSLPITAQLGFYLLLEKNLKLFSTSASLTFLRPKIFSPMHSMVSVTLAPLVIFFLTSRSMLVVSFIDEERPGRSLQISPRLLIDKVSQKGLLHKLSSYV